MYGLVLEALLLLCRKLLRGGIILLLESLCSGDLVLLLLLVLHLLLLVLLLLVLLHQLLLVLLKLLLELLLLMLLLLLVLLVLPVADIGRVMVGRRKLGLVCSSICRGAIVEELGGGVVKGLVMLRGVQACTEIRLQVLLHGIGGRTCRGLRRAQMGRIAEV